MTWNYCCSTVMKYHVSSCYIYAWNRIHYFRNKTTSLFTPTHYAISGRQMLSSSTHLNSAGFDLHAFIGSRCANNLCPSHHRISSISSWAQRILHVLSLKTNLVLCSHFHTWEKLSQESWRAWLRMYCNKRANLWMVWQSCNVTAAHSNHNWEDTTTCTILLPRYIILSVIQSWNSIRLVIEIHQSYIFHLGKMVTPFWVHISCWYGRRRDW